MAMRGKQPGGLLTQQKMLRAAVAIFLEKGYEHTTTAEIAVAAGMRPSSFFRAYPSKEAILLELVQRMFSGQFELAQTLSGPRDPVVLYAIETALQLHIAELSEPLRDLYVAAYSLPSTSSFIHHNMTKRLMGIFSAYLPQAQEKDFYEMEIASGGVMRGFMSVPCDIYFTVQAKIRRFLDCSLKLYEVPAQRRSQVISAVLAMDLHAMAAGIVRETARMAEEGFDTDQLRDGPERTPAAFGGAQAWGNGSAAVDEEEDKT